MEGDFIGLTHGLSLRSLAYEFWYCHTCCGNIAMNENMNLFTTVLPQTKRCAAPFHSLREVT
jgi:hypothetical protein